ncbi:MAG: protein-(glutamine-N5) methyltransferase, release factor-specific [Burkholderiales bacterium PBB1]|nr:MAG: protein-(glutamine-N5) methyltransferase, release factor-specific [Burkholderiales bacterium PBB1]
MTVAHALAEAHRAGVDRLDAQLMLAHLLRHPRGWLIAHDDVPLGAHHSSRYVQWLERRGAGEPLAYLLGQAEFCGLTLQVGPEVLIPRPETELLVEWGMQVLAGWPAPPTPARVIDLGCGSGAIALAIRHRHPTAAVTAVDTSAPALDLACRNAEALGLPITPALGNWWSAVAGQRFHLALANPPYVAPGDPHLEALRHEPHSALVAPEQGMADLHRLIDMAPESLHPGGWLLLEHGHDQGQPVRERLRQVGFSEVETRRDLAGLERCTGGRFG